MVSGRLLKAALPMLFALLLFACAASKPIESSPSSDISASPVYADQISVAADTPSPSPSRSPSHTPSLTPSPSVTATPVASAAILSAGPIARADGTYYGAAAGFRGDVEVLVTLQGGYITQISVLSYVDDERLFDRAKSALIARVLSAQGVDVDVVAGATHSSDGILGAVANALGFSYTEIA